MIQRKLYRDLLTRIQALYQGNFIDARERDYLVKIMSSSNINGKDQFLEEITYIKRKVTEKYAIRACEECELLLRNQ